MGRRTQQLALKVVGFDSNGLGGSGSSSGSASPSGSASASASSPTSGRARGTMAGSSSSARASTYSDTAAGVLAGLSLSGGIAGGGGLASSPSPSPSSPSSPSTWNTVPAPSHSAAVKAREVRDRTYFKIVESYRDWEANCRAANTKTLDGFQRDARERKDMATEEYLTRAFLAASDGETINLSTTLRELSTDLGAFLEALADKVDNSSTAQSSHHAQTLRRAKAYVVKMIRRHVVWNPSDYYTRYAPCLHLYTPFIQAYIHHICTNIYTEHTSKHPIYIHPFIFASKVL